MTPTGTPGPADAMWRAAGLKRACPTRDRARVRACLTGLDTGRLEAVPALLVLHHDELFDTLGEPSMPLREIDAAAAPAPAEAEFTTTTAAHRAGRKEVSLTQAVEALGPLDRVHAIAVCTVVMPPEAFGRTGTPEHLDDETAGYERLGHPRPYPTT